MSQIKLVIVTPEGSIFDGNVDAVYLPGAEGEIGVLPNHTAVMELMSAGELRIVQGGKDTFLAIGSGFADITQEEVSVMTEGAVDAAEIDEQVTQEAIDRAQAALRDDTISSEDAEEMQALLTRSLAQLDVKRRRRGGR